MATHSSILAWRIPWIKEPGWLQTTGHKESDMTEMTGHKKRNAVITTDNKWGKNVCGGWGVGLLKLSL